MYYKAYARDSWPGFLKYYYFYYIFAVVVDGGETNGQMTTHQSVCGSATME